VTTMFAKTDVFEAGQYYTEELERLTANPGLADPAEMALLVTQADIILDEMMRAFRPFRLGALTVLDGVSRALVALSRNEQPHEMLDAGVSPSVIRGLRRRKATMFARHLQTLRQTAYQILGERSHLSMSAGEWPRWVKYKMSYVRVWYLLALLSEMPIAYRLGFDIDAARTIGKLVRLLGGRPRV